MSARMVFTPGAPEWFMLDGQKYNPLPLTGALTVANIISDDTRLAGVQGDGATYPASMAGVWPAATNLISNGGFETNTTGWAAWAAEASIARVTTEAKFGSASLQVTVADLGSRGARYLVSLSASTVYTVSAWLKIPVGKTVGIYVYDTPVISKLVGVESAGTGDWVRVSATFTSDADGGNHSIFIMTYGDNDAVVFYIDGVQLETGSIATPYIETDGGTASRSLGRIRGTASVLDETQGWVAFRGLMGFGNSAEPSSFPALFEWADDASNRLLLYYEGSTNSWKAERKAAAAGAILAQALAVSIGDAVTVAMTWTASALAVESNGAAFSTTANSSIPTLAASTFDIGSMPVAVANNPFSGDILWAATGTGTLTDADAALFNSWGNNDPLPHMFPRSAQLTFLARFNGDGTAYRYSA